MVLSLYGLRSMNARLLVLCSKTAFLFMVSKAVIPEYGKICYREQE